MSRLLSILFPTRFDLVNTLVIVFMLIVIGGFLMAPTKCGHAEEGTKSRPALNVAPGDNNTSAPQAHGE